MADGGADRTWCEVLESSGRKDMEALISKHEKQISKWRSKSRTSKKFGRFARREISFHPLFAEEQSLYVSNLCIACI